MEGEGMYKIFGDFGGPWRRYLAGGSFDVFSEACQKVDELTDKMVWPKVSFVVATDRYGEELYRRAAAEDDVLGRR